MTNTTQGGKAERQLAHSMFERWQEVQGYTPQHALDLFQVFNLTGFAYKGQLTSGFGQIGYKGEASAGVNFGDLVAPGLVTASVEAGLGGERSGFSLLAVQRHPRHLYGERLQPELIPAEKNDKGEEIAPAQLKIDQKPFWKNGHPICVLPMRGSVKGMKFNLGAKVGVGVEADDVGELGISVSAGAEVGGELLHARVEENDVLHYAAVTDSELKSTFRDLLLTGGAKELNMVIAAWLAEEVGAEADQETETFLKEAGNVGQTLLADWAEKLGVNVEETALVKMLVKRLQESKTKDLAAALQNLNQGIQKQLQQTHSLRRRRQLEARQRQIDGFYELLTVKPQEERKKKRGNSGVAPVPHVNLSIVGGAAQAGAEAKAALELKGIGKAEGEGTAGVAGSASLVSYRFQTYTLFETKKSVQPLIYTQDTLLTYRDVEIKAALKAGVELDLPDGHPYKEPLEKEKEWTPYCYRTLTYRSANLFWTYPGGGGERVSLTPGEGSGLSFGSGIQLPRLLALVRYLAGEPGEDAKKLDKLLNQLAQQLRVPAQTLRRFLEQSGGKDGLLYQVDPEQFTVDTLLLESSFTFPGATLLTEDRGGEKRFLLTASRKENGWQLDDLLTQKEVDAFRKQLQKQAENGEDQPQLEALRLRYRLADRWDRSERLFKLGFSLVIKLGANLQRRKMAGHEGVVDLITWFAHEPFNHVPMQGYELTAPPVALLHH